MDYSKDRVRYSRIFGYQVECEKSDEFPDGIEAIFVPKNTLYTVRRGEFIHFGIARCHSKLDRFNKSKGRDIASNRARLALEENEIPADALLLHESGLRGTINANGAKNLLDYFHNVDVILLHQFNVQSKSDNDNDAYLHGNYYVYERDDGFVECND